MRGKKTKRIVKRVMSEVHHTPPKVVMETTVKKGPEAARKQKVAIGLNKARKKGARIPRRAY